MEVKALILMGGNSSRLGLDKTRISYHDSPQFEHLTAICQSLGLDTYLSCRPDQTLPAHYSTIKDAFIGIGPMGGLLSAMQTFPEVSWLVLAGDMPMINQQTIANLLEVHGDQSVSTYKSTAKSFPEVLVTIYAYDLMPLLQKAVDSKAYSLQSILKQVNTVTINPVDEDELFNVNDEGDLTVVKEKIDQLLK